MIKRILPFIIGIALFTLLVWPIASHIHQAGNSGLWIACAITLGVLGILALIVGVWWDHMSNGGAERNPPLPRGTIVPGLGTLTTTQFIDGQRYYLVTDGHGKATRMLGRLVEEALKTGRPPAE